MITLQELTVAMLVPGCAVVAAWKLMPSAARRALATRLLRLPNLPGPVALRLRKHAIAAGGCGCDGCDHSGKNPAARSKPKQQTKANVALGPVAQPIRFQPRPPR